MDTLASLLARRAAEHPDRPFVRFGERVQNYAELAGRVWRLARTMRELGVGPGKRVFVVCRRRPEAVEAFLATCAAGGIVVPVNHYLPPEELAELAAAFPPHLVVLDGALRGVVAGLPARTWGAARRIATAGPADVAYEDAAGGAAAEPLDALGPDDPAYYNFTSGSTGEPRAAVTSQAMVLWNTHAAVEAFSITDADVHLPLFAVFSHPHELFARALATGGSLALVDSIYPRAIAQAIEAHRATCVMGVATLYRLLLPFAEARRHDLASLRLPESGGMATDPRLNEAFRAATGVPIAPVWGSTETTGIALACPVDEPFPLDSIGRPCPHYEVRLVDEAGLELAVGATGEMLIRGPAVMAGYAGDAAGTAQALSGGWYHTGDLATADADGFYYFRGRRTSMIKVGGLKVFSEEVEAALERHPAVREAAVVPVAQELRGEVHRAYLVAATGETRPGVLELKRYLQGVIAGYKIPKELVFVERIPRTAGGKLDRGALRRGPDAGPGGDELGPASGPVPDEAAWRERLVQLDLQLLRLLSERAVAGARAGRRFAPEALEERLRALLGHNSGPLPDSLVEEIFRFLDSRYGMLG